jgi:hypothetical protein
MDDYDQYSMSLFVKTSKKEKNMQKNSKPKTLTYVKLHIGSGFIIFSIHAYSAL